MAKIFLPVKGRSMLLNTIAAAQELGGEILVVTGAYHDQTKAHLLAHSVQIKLVHNSDWRKGMSSSIAVGVEAASESLPDAYLITLCDQPDVDGSFLKTLAESYRLLPDNRNIVATAYPEGPGVPAVFPAMFTNHLLNAEGQGGVKELLRSGNYPVREVYFSTPPVDIDTPEDYLARTGKLPEEV